MKVFHSINDSSAFIPVMISDDLQNRLPRSNHSVMNGAVPNNWNQEDKGHFGAQHFQGGRRRSQIPEKPNHALSLWGVIKNCLGKELSKIPMPRLTEDLEYSELLDTAATCRSYLEQLCYVAAFSVSSYSTTAHRTSKPFNPLLGETFELDRLEDCGYRSLCEQVSHHPPAAAHHVWSQRGWSLWQEITIDSKFHGKCISVKPLGTIHLQFHASGNHYTWSKVTSTVHNIILGKLWIDQSGDIEIINHASKDSCRLTFCPYSYFCRDVSRKVTGVVTDSENMARYVLSGTWDDKIESAKIIGSSKATSGQKTVHQTESPRLLWKKYPLPENAENMYFFSSLALTLNEPEGGVAPTDSRLRPDQRLMEAGLWSEANAEKWRLEEEQRERRKRREAEARGSVEGNGHLAVWFERRTDPFTGESSFVYKGGYWEAKESQDWSVCPEIF
ncbi:hypothetical protein GJAV_G00043020 [Gymnothorax javanicus]|nr:hypothetical protein GJAV_G00043020 [Gymnothorax javanicus]